MPSAPNFRARWLRWTFTTAVLLVLPFASRAQTVSDREVKAAYLYNFAKFVEWPAGAFEGPTAPIRLCVFNQDALEADLRKIVTGKSVANHPALVVVVETEEQYRLCHVLFVGPSQSAKAKQILNGLRGLSVLTVGDSDGFVKQGGMIQFILDSDRVQFEVNHRAAEQVQLVVSSRLLRVAKAVIE